MQEKYEDLKPEGAQEIADTLLAQERRSFETLTEWDRRITNVNFVTNGAGAIACLAYLDAATGPPHMKLSLLLFTLGVVATGIELRAMYQSWAVIMSETSRRYRGFVNNELTVAEAAPVQADNRTATAIGYCAGWAFQLCFIAGVLIGGIGFFAD